MMIGNASEENGSNRIELDSGEWAVEPFETRSPFSFTSTRGGDHRKHAWTDKRILSVSLLIGAVNSYSLLSKMKMSKYAANFNESQVFCDIICQRIV